MKNLILFAILLTSSVALGHARLDFPVPRSNNAGIKTGPCGTDVKGNNPQVLVAGQQLTIQWRETIEHPGRYYFAFSDSGGDLNFVRQEDWTEIDLQNDRNNLPHLYSKTVTVPEIDCTNCTFQMIQSMEENPNNPRPYFSCADVTIQINNNNGGGNEGGEGENGSQSGNGGRDVASNSPEFGGFGGCGTIGAGGPPPPTGGMMALLLMPFFLVLFLREDRIFVRIKK